jgi:Ca2+-transporting ATPase
MKNEDNATASFLSKPQHHHDESSHPTAIKLSSGIIDGQVSIEMHLELHISDLTAIMASSATREARDAVLEEVLHNINYLLESRIKGKLPRLEYAVCERLCLALLVLTPQSRETERFNIFRASLSKNAQLALRIFAGFTKNVADFEDVVEDQDSEKLRKCLAFEEHLLNSEDDAHKEIALDLLKFMVANMPKYSDWKSLVNDDHAAVSELIAKSVPEISQHHEELSMTRLHRRVHPPKGQFYDVNPQQVLTIFETDAANGLTSKQVEERRERYGSNSLPKPPPPSILKMIIRQFTDFIIVVLLISVIVSAATGDTKAAVALSVVILVNTIIGFVQELKAEKALKGLASFSVSMAQVIRDGEQTEVAAEDLVPGDVVVLEEGFQVPADLRLIEVAQLYVIESLLTGESEPIAKKTDSIKTRKLVPIGDRVNMAFMSTLVTQGRGKGIVVNTALTTEVGRISAALGAGSKESTAPSLLQQKLARLGKWLVLLSIISCAFVILVGYLRKYDDIIQIGISLAVSVIPEGLVVVVTLTLAVGTQKMAQKKAIVRLPPVVETLGAITTICSDKTGTLTVGNMVASAIVTNQSFAEFTSEKGDPHSGKMIVKSKKSPDEASAEDDIQLSLCILLSALCNNSSMKRLDEKAEKKWETLGDPTEVALLAASMKANMSLEFWDKKNFKRLHEISFTAERKRMSVTVSLPPDSEFVPLLKDAADNPNEDSKYLVLSKGAVETIIPRCSKFVKKENGKFKISPLLDQGDIKELESECEALAARGMRVLGLAIRTFAHHPFLDNPELKADDSEKAKNTDLLAAQVEKSMTFIGIVGIIDPPRPEVAGSVKTCHEANIRVCMITGDHRVTAASIAETLGILKPGGRVVSGVELSAISSEELAKFNPFPNVFARVNPDDKLKIVQALQKRGDVVAMTGDGVNDAPAIKNADVGIAMGISGTEITRQAASMILTDDNFSTIVSAVSEGRRVFDNIQKFIIFLLSMNFSQVALMLSAIIIGLSVPFSALMILWANIFVAVPPSISLGVEPAEPSVMTRPPRDPKKGVLSRQKTIILLMHVFFLAGITLVVFGTEASYGRSDNDQIYAKSLAFATLFTLHLVHSLMARSVSMSIFSTGVYGNKYLFWGCWVSFFFILIAIYIPGLNDLIELVPIDAIDWLRVLAAIIVHVFLVELLKLYVRRHPDEPTVATSAIEDGQNDADERFKEIQIQMAESEH